ncbi:hypothetical protein [Acinetobacter sp. NIPH 2699]|uniref:hypothetical protein n=1 Tax=Acinetobacter sp. NIPH 2699 TaxID=2923433 RepID=UPI001F4B29CD|nr:hypothetical protein [Acinetobacter sp. NIPH 2699]MCH7337002.1 hypothetical protein [Acinetobacter sp. NIPH 2699]
MYNHNKRISILGLLSTIIFLSACGGGSSNSDTNYTTPKVETEVKTDLKFLNTPLPSAQSKNVNEPVYRYTQIFTKENNQFKQSYQLEFDFNIDTNTLYRLEANYDELINSTPNSIKLIQFKKNGRQLSIQQEFRCSKNDNPCPTIISSINIKTGQAMLNFNNLLLSKSAWTNELPNTITLSGFIEGILTEAPTKVQLPSSQSRTLNVSALPSELDQKSSLSTQYKKLSFTNHNQAAFQLEELSIGIQNNQVQYVSLTPPNLILYPFSCGIYDLKCTNGVYNPNDYSVIFNNTKLHSLMLGYIYLYGSTGL